MLGSSKMIGIVPLIVIFIINVNFMEKIFADGKNDHQPNGQKAVLKKEENHPVAYYSRGCLPTESRLAVPCKPDNHEEYAKHGVQPNAEHEKCSEFEGMTATCRYNFERNMFIPSEFICCVPKQPKGISWF